RQGQGIIDIVNTYIGVTLFHGFVALAIFLSFILSALFRTQRAARAPPFEADLTPLGSAIAGSTIGMLLMLADCGFFLGVIPIFFVLSGLSVTYARLRSTVTHSTAVAAGSPSP